MFLLEILRSRLQVDLIILRVVVMNASATILNNVVRLPESVMSQSSSPLRTRRTVLHVVLHVSASANAAPS